MLGVLSVGRSGNEGDFTSGRRDVPLFAIVRHTRRDREPNTYKGTALGVANSSGIVREQNSSRTSSTSQVHTTKSSRRKKMSSNAPRCISAERPQAILCTAQRPGDNDHSGSQCERFSRAQVNCPRARHTSAARGRARTMRAAGLAFFSFRIFEARILASHAREWYTRSRGQRPFVCLVLPSE